MSSAAKPSPQVKVRGILRRELYSSPDGDFTVAELMATDDARLLVVAGPLIDCRVGDTVEVHGRSTYHPKFGPQIRVDWARWIPPATEDGLVRFLSRGTLRGIGRELAKRIVKHFGTKTIDVMDAKPERLREVEGIGPRRAEQVAEAWAACRERAEDEAFLAGLGLGAAMVGRVRRKLGDDAAQRIREDPYRLNDLVEGIGFRRADEVARRLDVEADAPSRLRGGIEHVLTQASDDGHVYLLRSQLIRAAADLLSLPPGPVEDAVARLIRQQQLVVVELNGEQAVYRQSMRRAEEEVAREFERRVQTITGPSALNAAEALHWVEPRLGLTLTDDQRAALRTLFEQRCAVLTGGPGVGKTTIVRALSEVFLARGWEIALAAPTGRAARRLAEACGHPASTLHRLLRFNPQTHRFAYRRDNPLVLDALLIDEVSMMDLLLMRSVLRALPRTARLILIGDADQLPSVGPGDVLRSIVESNFVPVARLQRILRQKEGSTIVRAAHQVLQGDEPEFENVPVEGAFFVERDDPYEAQRVVVKLVAERLPERFGLRAQQDVQVLSPMHRGPLGTKALNQRLKQALNPGDAEDFSIGDRVLQTRNNYDLEVFNGEIGRVVRAAGENRPLTVDFEDRKVEYPTRSGAELELAYAITVHKSQGGEFPAVVLALSMQHFMLLRRNLLYTAITRARRILVVVASRRALVTAVEAGSVERRRSLLQQDLERAGLSAGEIS